MTRIIPCIFCLVLFASTFQVYAQDTVTGAFEGVVSDSQTGVALKSALVEITNQQTGLTITLRTDFRGRFYQGLLTPGIYRIRVSASNYETREVLQRLRSGSPDPLRRLWCAEPSRIEVLL